MQTVESWELIVIEDGPTDGSDKILNDFKYGREQFIYYASTNENLGVASTRNALIRTARGKVIAFLDADDWWDPHHLEYGLEALSTGNDIVVSGWHLYNEETQQTMGEHQIELECFAKPMQALFEKNFIHTSSAVMMLREVTTKVGSFDTELRVGEDADYWLRCLRSGFKLGNTKHSTCYYRKHSKSVMAFGERVALDKVIFYRKYLGCAYLEIGLRKRGLASSLVHLARMIRKQHPLKARALLTEAIKLKPTEIRYWIFLLATYMVKR